MPEVDDFDCVFLVLEYIAYDMKKFLSKTSCQIEFDHLKVITYNLLCAVNYLHSVNVMHRDIKPKNILIDCNCNIKITGLGQARTIESKDLDSKRPKTVHVTSRWYRAPEIILGKEDYDASVDCWSLGCVLGELLSYSRIREDKSLKSDGRILQRGDSSRFPVTPKRKNKTNCSSKNMSFMGSD